MYSEKDDGSFEEQIGSKRFLEFLLSYFAPSSFVQTPLNEITKNYLRWVKVKYDKQLPRNEKGKIKFISLPKTRIIVSLLRDKLGVDSTNSYASVTWRVSLKTRFWQKNCPVLPLQELIAHSLLKPDHNETLEDALERKWYTVWNHPHMAYASEDMREMLLCKGIGIEPSVASRTISLHTQITKLIAISEQTSRDDQIGIDDYLRTQKKYGKWSHNPSTLSEEVKEQSRVFLQTILGQPIDLRKFPVEISDSRAAILQAKRYWAPILVKLFGNEETTVYCLSKTPEFGPYFKEDKEQMEKHATKYCQEYIKKAQEIWDINTPSILKSGTASNSSLEKMRKGILLTSKNDEEENEQQKAKTYKPPIPKLLREGDTQALEHDIVKIVTSKGGGFNIKNWSSLPVPQGDTEAHACVQEASRKKQLSYGSWIKQIYHKAMRSLVSKNHIKSLEQCKDKLQHISGNKNLQSQKWNSWVQKHEIWKGIHDAAFVAYTIFHTEIHPRKRRGKRKIDGLKMAGPPRSKAITEKLKEKAIGDWDKPVVPKPVENLNDLAVKFENNHYPVGRICYTRLNADNATHAGRWINIGVALTFLLVLAYRLGVLKVLPVGTSMRIKFGIWLDGATILGYPVLMAVVYIVWDPDYTTSSKLRWVDAVRYYPFALLVMPETLSSINEIASWIRKCASNLPKLKFKGVEYTFNLKYISADHKAMQKLFGNAVGGHYRCEGCTINFSEKEECWDYAHLRKAVRKDLRSIINMWKANTASQVGLTRVPLLFADSVDELVSLNVDETPWLSETIASFDCLHNSKGHLKSLLYTMLQWAKVKNQDGTSR